MSKKSTKPAIDRETQLIKELEAIRQKKRASLRAKYHPALIEKYEGKFFKYRNTYGGDCEGWWLYIFVRSIELDGISVNGHIVSSSYNGWSFQTIPSGEINIDMNVRGYTHSVLGEEITEAEFNAAYNKMIDSINSLK